MAIEDRTDKQPTARNPDPQVQTSTLHAPSHHGQRALCWRRRVAWKKQAGSDFDNRPNLLPTHPNRHVIRFKIRVLGLAGLKLKVD